MGIYSSQISVDTDTILNEVITKLGVTVDSSILNPVLQSTITEMKSFISGLNLSVLASDSDAISNTFKELLDSIYKVLNDSVNNIFYGIDNQKLLDTLQDVLAEKITLSPSFETSIIDTLTQSLNLDVESIKKAALESLLAQLGLDIGLLEKDTRDAIAEEMVQDVYDRLSMDEDFQDIPTLTYKIVDGTIITTVYDENGQDITSSLSLNSTSVTIDSDGSYTVVNSSFDTLNALYDVKVEFNYVVNDGQADSEPKTVTVTNEVLDLDSNGALSFGDDDYINLGNILENVSDNFDVSAIDSIDLSNTEHILSNLTIIDFESMVSDDASNTLSIDGESGDKIKLDLSTWSKEEADKDNNSVLDNSDDGYIAYTAKGTLEQTLTLLIDKDITVENV
jgi:hypothetical protein